MDQIDEYIRIISYAIVAYSCSHMAFDRLALRRHAAAGFYLSVSIHFLIILTLVSFSSATKGTWGNISHFGLPSAVVMAAAALYNLRRKGF